MRRAVAAVVLMMLAGSIGAPAMCAGWEGSAAERLACCLRAQHADCHDQAAADDCCAGGEQSRQPASTIAQKPPAPPLQVVGIWAPAFDTVRFELRAATLVQQSLTRQLHDPPGLSRTPLRI